MLRQSSCLFSHSREPKTVQWFRNGDIPGRGAQPKVSVGLFPESSAQQNTPEAGSRLLCCSKLGELQCQCGWQAEVLLEEPSRWKLAPYSSHLAFAKNNKKSEELKVQARVPHQSTSGVLDLTVKERHFTSQAKRVEIWYSTLKLAKFCKRQKVWTTRAGGEVPSQTSRNVGERSGNSSAAVSKKRIQSRAPVFLPSLAFHYFPLCHLSWWERKEGQSEFERWMHTCIHTYIWSCL